MIGEGEQLKREKMFKKKKKNWLLSCFLALLEGGQNKVDASWKQLLDLIAFLSFSLAISFEKTKQKTHTRTVIVCSSIWIPVIIIVVINLFHHSFIHREKKESEKGGSSWKWKNEEFSDFWGKKGKRDIYTDWGAHRLKRQPERGVRGRREEKIKKACFFQGREIHFDNTLHNSLFMFFLQEVVVVVCVVERHRQILCVFDPGSVRQR